MCGFSSILESTAAIHDYYNDESERIGTKEKQNTVPAADNDDFNNNQLNMYEISESVIPPALSGKMHSICPVEARLDSTLNFNDANFQHCTATELPVAFTPAADAQNPILPTGTNQSKKTHRLISILYQNVRGLRTKVDEFFVAVSDVQYDVIVLTETWLNECFHSAQLFGDAYNVFRCDRNPLSTGKRRGGGVLIAVANRLDSKISSVQISDEVEQLWIKIVGLYRTICLGVVYISPDCASNVISIQTHVDSALRQSHSLQPNDMHIVCGDYNQPNLSWTRCSNGYAFPDPNSSAFSHASSALVDGFALLGMRQMSTIANSRNRTLDLVFMNDVAKDACTLSEAYEPIIEADLFHPAILITLCISLPISYESNTESNEFNFAKADFVALNQSLRNTDWAVLENVGDVDLAADFFSETLKQLFRLHVPIPRPRIKPPWSNARLRFLKRKRSAALRKYTIRRNPSTKQVFSRISNEYKNYNRDRYSEYVRRKQNDLKNRPKRFWSFVNEKRNQTGLPSNMFLEDLVSVNVQTTCDLFARHFASVFSSTVASDSQIDAAMRNIPENVFELNTIHFSEADIKVGLLRLKTSNKAGPDGIPSVVLKKCSDVLCKPLQKICNMSLSQNKFPDSWKKSYIFPVYKKGDKCNITNYRGITSLCVGSKLLEVLVGELLFSKVKSYITMEQHGFFPKRSINTNLLQFSSFCIRQMEENSQVDTVYTDLKAAFDRIDHHLLLRKLKRLGVSNDFVQWLRTYLTNRSLSVKIGSNESYNFCNLSGVPQGSNLGPLLFLIFFNDVCFVIPPGCKLLYADDLKIFLAVRCLEDCKQLQNLINRFAEWCRMNNLTISISKCSIITFTRRKSPILYDYTIEGTPLERVDVVKDLGVELDSKLTFQNHYSSIISKANRNLGFIMHIAKDFRDPYCLRALYFSLVRSHLDTASVVWSPYSNAWKSRLEAIQHRFIRYALRHLPWSDPVNLPPYEDRCNLLNITTLNKRRNASKAMFVAKLLVGEIDAPELLSMLNINAVSRPLRSRDFLRPVFHRTLYGQHEPIQAMCCIFNSVYHLFDFSVSLEQFKSRILRCDVLD